MILLIYNVILPSGLARLIDCDLLLAEYEVPANTSNSSKCGNESFNLLISQYPKFLSQISKYIRQDESNDIN